MIPSAPAGAAETLELPELGDVLVGRGPRALRPSVAPLPGPPTPPNTEPLDLDRSRARDESPSVEAVTDATAFAALREPWGELLEASPSAGVFLSWEWLHTWWKHFGRGRRPEILVVRRGGRPLALAPLVAGARRAGVRPRTLRLMGSGRVGSDYLDLLVRAGDRESAIEALAERLDRERPIVELEQVAREESAAARLVAALERRGWSSVVTFSHVCPYIELEGLGWDDYLAGLGASHRANVRRRLRKLESSFAVSFDRVETAAELDGALDALLRLHQSRWADRGGSDALAAAPFADFHREFAALALERGWLRLYVLRLDGRPAAALYGLRDADRFLFYQSGFDPAFEAHSVGLACMAMSIRAAIAEGVREYDLLHGDEPYKFLWARRTRELTRVELYPPSIGAWLRRELRRSVRSVKSGLRAGAGWLAPAAVAPRGGAR